MNLYKQKVLEYTGTTLNTENREGDYSVTFEKVRTADKYYIYVDIDHGDWQNVIPDLDIFVHPLQLQSRIEENINLGAEIYADEEILIACELHEYGERWEILYEKWIEEVQKFHIK